MSSARPPRRFWSACALGGVTVVALGLFWQVLAAPRPAYGQVPDSGMQRKVMIQELQTANKKLTEVVGLLREIRDTQVKQAKEREPRRDGR